MGRTYWTGYALAVSAAVALYTMALLTGAPGAATLATLATQAMQWLGL